MAYNLPLQLVIQPPTQGQLNSIRQSVESALSGINVGSVDAKNFAKTNVAIQQTGKQFEKTGQKAEKFWDSVEGRTRSAIAYTAISTALMKVTGAVSQATREAIKYEAELLKISQVTGDSVQLTKEYSKSLVDISKKYNVTLSKVAQLTRTLNQTGLSFKEAAKGAEVLARTSLLATFDSLTSTTEGLIAVMQTFEFTVTRAGKVLESINSVSKAFAVESTDIVEAIRRTGGAFSTAGGSIEELIALFTAVRSTSRESAETIATGFRTIFGRLQRPKTIEYFKQLGIQLETAEGQFIGPYQAIEQISKGLERLGIAAGSTRFAEVVEQIGGIRQISRVVPLLEQAAKSQKALDIANSGTVDSIKDVEKAQQGLGYQLGALQKEFGALISDVVNSPSFKFLAEVFINTSKAVLRLVSSLKPLLPILASVAAFKIGRGLSKLLSGGFSLKGAKESLGFASGGMVPGSGNSDTVPAMLTPGEFVIRKSAVQAFGADRLASINKYANGGYVVKRDRADKISENNDVYDKEIKTPIARLINRIAKEMNGGKRTKQFATGNTIPGLSAIRGSILEKSLGLASASDPTDDQSAFDYEPYIGTDATKQLGFDKINGLTTDAKATREAANKEEFIKKIANFQDAGGSTSERVFGAALFDKGSDLPDLQISELDVASYNAQKKKFGGIIQRFMAGGYAKPVSPKQLAFLESLVAKNGVPEGFEYPPKTSAQASALIDRIKNPPKQGLDINSLFNEYQQIFGMPHPQANDIEDSNEEDLRNLTQSLDKTIEKYNKFANVIKEYYGKIIQQDSWNGSFYALGGPNPRMPKRAELDQFVQGGGFDRNLLEQFGARGDAAFGSSVNAPRGRSSSALKTRKSYMRGYAEGGVVDILGDTGSALFSALYSTGSGVIGGLEGGIKQSFKAAKDSNLLGNIQGLGSELRKGLFPTVEEINQFDKTGKNNSDILGATLKASGSLAKTLGSGVLGAGFGAVDSFAKAGVESGLLGKTAKAGTTIGKGLFGLGKKAGKSGYNAISSLFQKKAEGGSIEDSVPALLTPGEFVINKKSAQEFGYDKLHEINKYAKGGFVDGLQVQQFKKGGMSKADRGGVSDERRKFLKEQARAKRDAEAGGPGITRAGKREVGQLARGMDQVDFIAVQEKWTKYIDEETKNAKEVYQAKVKQVQEEGGSIKEMSALIKEYDSVIQTIKSEAKGYQRKEEESISAANIKEAEAQVKQKESDAATAETPAAKEVEKTTKSLAQKIKDGGGAVYDSLSSLGVSYAEAAFQAQSIVSGLKNFAGLDVNQEALTQAQVKGGVLSGAGEAVGKLADPKVIEGFGSQLNKVGKMLPKSIGGPVRKLGGTLLKNGASIAKGFSMAAKGLNILSYVELGGGLLDALFSTDYGKQRDNLIALGDAAGAASAAAKAYSQEQYRAIPLIGGFLSAMGAGSQATEADLDSTGKLVVANARLEANLNGIDREVTKAKTAFKDAQALGDLQGQKDAISAQLDAADKLKENSEIVGNRTNDLRASGTATYGSSGSMLKGAGAGALGGAAIGAAIGSVFPVIGTAIGAGVGALVGGTAGAVASWMSSSKLAKEQIIKGYELQGEAATKAAEVQAEMIGALTDRLQSEAVRMVRSGGTYQDAINKVTEQIGQENVDRILDGRQLTGNAEDDINAVKESIGSYDERIAQIKSEAALLKDSEKTKKAELEAQLATVEGEKTKAVALKDGLVQTQSAIIKEKQLEERRMIEAKAMEYQIALLEEMESAYDGFNATMAEAKNIAEEAANIGTNNLTTRQAAAMSGVGDSRIYDMSADRIVDTPEVASQMAARVGLNTMRGQEILKGQERVQTLSRIKGEVVDTGALKDIYANVQDGETADAKQIQDAIYEKLGLTEGADPVLDEEIRKYSERIAKDGISAAGEAAQQAKEGATAQSKQIIEEQQKIDKELFDAQKQLRQMQIDLVQKQMANAQQAYDNEKDYFEKRSALANKVEDVLSPIKEGPGKAAAMAARGAARTGAARDALGARRRKQFGEVGLGGQSLGQAVNSVAAGFEAAGGASEELKGQMDALMSTIQDEIQIEQDYLDSLIEVAKAQQEYTQALNDAQGDLVRNLVTGTEEEVGNQLTALNAAAVAASQGSFAGIPEELKKDVFALFDQFGDIEIPGLGMTGRDAQREITKNELMRNFGYDEQTASKLASKAVKDKVPVDERMAEQIREQEKKIAALLNYEKQLKDAQLAQERENTQLFAQKVEEFAAAVNKMASQAGNDVADTAVQTGMNMAGYGASQGVAGGAATGAALGSTGLFGANTAVGTGLGAAAGAAAGAAPGLMFAADAATGGGASRAMNALGGFAQTAAGALFGGLATDEPRTPMPGSDVALQQEKQKQYEDAKTAYENQKARKKAMQAEAAKYGDDDTMYKVMRDENIGQNEYYKRRDQYAAAASRASDEQGRAMTEMERAEQALASTQQGSAPTTNNQNTPPVNTGAAANTPVQQPGSRPSNDTNNQMANNAPMQQRGPIQVETQGQQEITVRLPDIQGIVNQQITALVYEAVGSKFNQVAGDVRSAQNFDDVANALSGGVSETSTRNV